MATTCRQFLSKGSHIVVTGHLELWQWQTKDGQPRQELGMVATEIKFIDRGNRRESAPVRPNPAPADESHRARGTSDDATPPVPEDDIPF